MVITINDVSQEISPCKSTDRSRYFLALGLALPLSLSELSVGSQGFTQAVSLISGFLSTCLAIFIFKSFFCIH